MTNFGQGYCISSNYRTGCLGLFLGVLYLEILKCQNCIDILHEIRVDTMIKQLSILFNLTESISLTKLVSFKWGKCKIWVFGDTILVGIKRGGAIIVMGALFGVYTVLFFSYVGKIQW